MKLFNLFTRKPSPPPQVLDVAAARERARQSHIVTINYAATERVVALLEKKHAINRKHTQDQKKAQERLERATDRCLELGV